MSENCNNFDKVHLSEAIDLLQGLIAIPSFSKEENKTADCIASYLRDKGIVFYRKENNIWACNKLFDSTKPSILLNSHHDTVKPNKGWSKDPFKAQIEDGKLFGLGSNDAGGCLVSLLVTFLNFYEGKDLKYNLIFAATGEEEISGPNGIECILAELGNINFAIVGEPTQMQMAVAEKGLMVLDCTTYGKAGHAAREEGDNAIYKALKDIEWFRDYQFEKISSFLGPVKMTVTMIQAGEQHNVVPNVCHFTADIRLTEEYTHIEVLEIIRTQVKAETVPRSTRLKPSKIDIHHPIVQAGVSFGLKPFGSSTTSDQALMPFQSLKMGPGDSARSHSADEYIYLREVEEGINLYINILEKVIR